MLRMRQWSIRHARLLERVYRVVEHFLRMLSPVARLIGFERIRKPLTTVERAVKEFLFDCKMCGQCVLSATGMSCPMNCPKKLRNGPCGGVRADGNCEVYRDMRCVWVEAWSGSQRMSGKRLSSVPNGPVDMNLAGSSSWLQVVKGSAVPPQRHAGAEPRAAPADTGSRLEELLRAGEFVVTAEMAPPDSADPEEVRARLGPFGGCVDALNVTDGSGANCHMSSLGAAAILLSENCEPVMQIACRDRNRIAIQADILGAAALGIRNMLCLTGDYVANGDQPGAKPVFDLDSVTLLETARRLRDEGRFMSGRTVSGRPRVFLGGADNPFVPPREFRASRFAKKIAAGAQFVQTQYCFDLELLDRYMRQVRSEGLHERCFILIGVGPVLSARRATWIREHVPGVWIPQHVIKRLERAKDAREQGLRMCVEHVRQIKQIKGVAGIHLMAFKNEKHIARIVGEAGLFAERKALFMRGSRAATPVTEPALVALTAAAQ